MSGASRANPNCPMKFDADSIVALLLELTSKLSIWSITGFLSPKNIDGITNTAIDAYFVRYVDINVNNGDMNTARSIVFLFPSFSLTECDM